MELNCSTLIFPVLQRLRILSLLLLPLLLPPPQLSGEGVVGVVVGVGVIIIIITMERNWCWKRDVLRIVYSCEWRERRRDFWKLVIWWLRSAGKQFPRFSILLLQNNYLDNNNYNSDNDNASDNNDNDDVRGYEGQEEGGVWWSETKRKGSIEEEKRKPKKRKKRKEYTTKKKRQGWRNILFLLYFSCNIVIIYPFFVFRAMCSSMVWEEKEYYNNNYTNFLNFYYFVCFAESRAQGGNSVSKLQSGPL